MRYFTKGKPKRFQNLQIFLHFQYLCNICGENSTNSWLIKKDTLYFFTELSTNIQQYEITTIKLYNSFPLTNYQIKQGMAPKLFEIILHHYHTHALSQY